MLLLGCSVTWIASIQLTVPAINSALYQLYTPFTYVFSIPILREGCSASKTFGVLLALGAVLMIIGNDAMQEGGGTAVNSSLPPRCEQEEESEHHHRRRQSEDQSHGHAELIGDMLVLISAALYAMKGVLYKKWFDHRPDGAAAAAPAPPHTPVCDGVITVGLMGLWSCLMGPPIMLTAHVSGVEPFSLPPSVMLGGYFLVALLSMTYMACLLAALAYSTPTFVAIVSLFVSPVTTIWDVAAGRTRLLSPLAVGGMGLLIVALLAVISYEPIDARLRVHAQRLAQRLSGRAPLLHEHRTATVVEEDPPGSVTEPARAINSPARAIAPPANAC